MKDTGGDRRGLTHAPSVSIEAGSDGSHDARLAVAHAFPFNYTVDARLRAAQQSQTPCVIWLTGLSGAGKSTIAQHLETHLVGEGLRSYVLDGDALRGGLNADLGFSREDRSENARRVAEVARLMYDAGLIVIVALISPFADDRDAARRLFAPGDFLEVHVDTTLAVCAGRDTKGLYAKARAGDLATMTGYGQDYEVPTGPELVVHGIGDVHESVRTLFDAVVAIARRQDS